MLRKRHLSRFQKSPKYIDFIPSHEESHVPCLRWLRCQPCCLYLFCLPCPSTSLNPWKLSSGVEFGCFPLLSDTWWRNYLEPWNILSILVILWTFADLTSLEGPARPPPLSLKCLSPLHFLPLWDCTRTAPPQQNSKCSKISTSCSYRPRQSVRSLSPSSAKLKSSGCDTVFGVVGCRTLCAIHGLLVQVWMVIKRCLDATLEFVQLWQERHQGSINLRYNACFSQSSQSSPTVSSLRSNRDQICLPPGS